MEGNFLVPNKIIHAFPFNPIALLLKVPNTHWQRQWIQNTIYCNTMIYSKNNQNVHQKETGLLKHKHVFIEVLCSNYKE